MAMLVAAAAFGWLVWRIECPVCHGDKVDAEGRRRLGGDCPCDGDWECWWRDSSAPNLESVTRVPGQPPHDTLPCVRQRRNNQEA